MESSIWIYAWDLLDEGIANTVDALADVAHLTGLSMATSYHAGRFLLPHNPKRKVYFPADGTIYFRPDLSRYGRIEPLVNPLVNETDVLADTIRHAHARDMSVHSWTVCLHNSALGQRYPDCTTQNAYGDSSRFALCPANPDARQYLVTMVTDLVANYDLASIELESPEYMGWAHRYHHEKFHVPFSPLTAFLMSLCFCPSCMARAQEANVDADAVRQEVRSYLDEVLEQGGDHEDPSTPMPQYDVLAQRVGGQMGGYLHMRGEVVQSLLEAVVAEAGAARPVVFRPMVGAGGGWQSGTDARRASRLTGSVVVASYTDDPAQVGATAQRAHEVMHPGTEIVMGLQPMYPTADGPDTIAAQVQVCRDAGVAQVNLYNYGLMPRRNLGWIGQALGG